MKIFVQKGNYMDKIFSTRDVLENLVNATSGHNCDKSMSLEDKRVL